MEISHYQSFVILNYSLIVQFVCYFLFHFVSFIYFHIRLFYCYKRILISKNEILTIGQTISYSMNFSVFQIRIWWRTTSMVHNGNIWSTNKYTASKYIFQVSSIHCWWIGCGKIVENHYLCHQCKRSKWICTFRGIYIKNGWKTNW